MTPEQQRQRSLQTACRCAEICNDYRGRETIVLDLTTLTPIVDFFVITTGTSGRQMHALAEEVERSLKEQGEKLLGMEGADSTRWILQDYGDVVLHVFNEDARKLYDLEHLWADAERIDWETGEPTDDEPPSDKAADDDQ